MTISVVYISNTHCVPASLAVHRATLLHLPSQKNYGLVGHPPVRLYHRHDLPPYRHHALNIDHIYTDSRYVCTPSEPQQVNSPSSSLLFISLPLSLTRSSSWAASSTTRSHANSGFPWPKKLLRGERYYSSLPRPVRTKRPQTKSCCFSLGCLSPAPSSSRNELRPSITNNAHTPSMSLLRSLPYLFHANTTEVDTPKQEYIKI